MAPLSSVREMYLWTFNSIFSIQTKWLLFTDKELVGSADYVFSSCGPCKKYSVVARRDSISTAV